MKPNPATELLKTLAMYISITIMLLLIVLLASELKAVAELPQEFADGIRLGVGSVVALITFGLAVDIQSYVSAFGEFIDVRITSAVNSVIALMYGSLVLRFDGPVIRELVFGLTVALFAFAMAPFIAPRIRPYVSGGETA